MKQIKLDSMWVDSRGWSLEPLAAAGMRPEAIGNLHAASIAPGGVRGNHVHPDATEWLLVFGGPFEILWRPTPDSETQTVKVKEAGPFLFEFPANEPHTVCNVSSGDIYILAFNNQAKPETQRCELI